MAISMTFLSLFAFMAIGMPIAFALGVAGGIGLLIYGGWDILMGMLQTTPHSSSASFLFSTIPMYILMAEFMTKSGSMNDFYYAANKWFGHLKGGLGISTIFAGAGMGAVSGSSMASASAMATTGYPEMKKYGYKTSFAMGIVSSSGTLAIMIPPSLAMIIYGVLTEVPIGTLFIAGIIPGLLTAVGYMVVVRLAIKMNPSIAPSSVEPAPFKERIHSLKDIWPMLLLITVVISAIYTGFATATEAGAVGAFAALLIALIKRRLTFEGFKESLLSALKTTTMILTIIIGAYIFGYFLTMTQVTQNLVNFIADADISKWVVLIIICLIYLILGLFLDAGAILILTVPLTFPIMMALNFDPIWYGVIIVKLVEVGLLSPPVGMNVYVASGAANVDVKETFKGVVPFIVCEMALLIILILFPSIVTFLPSIMK